MRRTMSNKSLEKFHLIRIVAPKRKHTFSEQLIYIYIYSLK